jgi:hypothetical protein
MEVARQTIAVMITFRNLIKIDWSVGPALIGEVGKNFALFF